MKYSTFKSKERDHGFIVYDDNDNALVEQDFAPRLEGFVSMTEEEARQYAQQTMEEYENPPMESSLFPDLTPLQQRKLAYETEPIINWEGQFITVDEANKLWTDYAAEDSAKAELLTGLIKEAKTAIRGRGV